jgi:hypothetical protein
MASVRAPGAVGALDAKWASPIAKARRQYTCGSLLLEQVLAVSNPARSQQGSLPNLPRRTTWADPPPRARRLRPETCPGPHNCRPCTPRSEARWNRIRIRHTGFPPAPVVGRCQRWREPPQDLIRAQRSQLLPLVTSSSSLLFGRPVASCWFYRLITRYDEFLQITRLVTFQRGASARSTRRGRSPVLFRTRDRPTCRLTEPRGCMKLGMLQRPAVIGYVRSRSLGTERPWLRTRRHWWQSPVPILRRPLMCSFPARAGALSNGRTT